MLKFATAIAVTLIVAGCAGTKLEEAKMASPEADEHGQLLYEGYIRLSEAEYSEGDYKDSDFFAEQAMRAGSGEKFEPQQINARDLPTESLNDAAAARRKLIVALYNGAAQKHPREAAQAQLGFDCWMQEKEEDFQIEDIAICRRSYQEAITRLGVAMTETVIVPDAAPDTHLTFEVFFDFDSDELSSLAKSNLAIISTIISGYDEPIVSLIGNADQSGAAEYNYDLAGRRAASVGKVLVDNSVPIAGIYNHGDTVPNIELLDQSPLWLNRRVTIVVQEGSQ
jgi:OOP family OmpA-OmpF porin